MKTPVSMPLFSFLLVCCTVWASDPAPPASQPESPASFSVTLDDGRLAAKDLLARLCTSLGFNAPKRLQSLDWSFQVDNAFARNNLRLLARATGSILAADCGPDQVTFSVDRQAFDDQLSRLGSASRTAIRKLLETADLSSSHELGLSYVTRADARATIDSLPPGCSRAVILVHGLDNPGLIWRDLIPLLQQAGHTVILFHYPNDGPIPASADLFARSLAALRARGIRSVDVVAHSMGGLVARDLLTRADHYSGDGAGSATLPAVDHFIMVGTPNHGSHFAHLHPLSELGEQSLRLFALNGKWDGFSADGDGQAASDLLPGSTFLADLNARPLPSHTELTIIAGRWMKHDAPPLELLAQKIDHALTSDRSPLPIRDFLARHHLAATVILNQTIKSLASDLGDGVVTVPSAQLQGVSDYSIVNANHISLLFGDPADSSSSALPIILDRLAHKPD